MKLTTIFILVAIMQVSANGYSKNVTLNETKVNSNREVANISNALTTGLVSKFNIEQQRADVRGKVIDASGEALIGVSVRVKGSETGASTDVNGNFSLNAPDNATLVFTYIGYVTQEVAVNARTTVNVTLVEDRQALSEVVVTAFGVTKAKRGLGYAVQEVRGEEFTEARQNNIANSLTGKIAGVDATQANSGAGGSSRVIIRGNTSLNGNQQPLYVVDGMPITNTNRGPVTSTEGLNADRGDGISSINPDDIATISVLKGGAAAALYGSQAANGVILITTKKELLKKVLESK